MTPIRATGVAARAMRHPRRSLTVLAAMLLVSTFATGGEAQCAKQEIYVPSYEYPCSGTSNCAWDTFKKNATLVIINPNSGPGSSSNPDYVTLVNNIKKGNSSVKKVLGYVSTSYGSRNSSAVLADIDTYYRWYNLDGNLDGIFLDEGSTSCTTSVVNLYNSYDARVKSKGGQAYTILNWGTYGNQCYLTGTNISDYVTFEGYFSDYDGVGSPPTWASSYPSSRFWNILHTAPVNATAVTAAVAKSKTRNIGQIYITDDVMPNPFDTAPSPIVWNALVAEAASCT